MTELLISIFVVWFAELSLLPQNFTDWLMSKSILYKEYDGTSSKVVFNRYTDKLRIPIRLKPFDCTKCLGFWMGLTYSYFVYDSLLLAVLIGGVCSFISMTISKLYRML
jgi:hypothetical protein